MSANDRNICREIVDCDCGLLFLLQQQANSSPNVVAMATNDAGQVKRALTTCTQTGAFSFTVGYTASSAFSIPVRSADSMATFKPLSKTIWV